MQAAVLPRPYHVLAKMFDDAERMDYKTVRKVLEQELKLKMEDVSKPDILVKWWY